MLPRIFARIRAKRKRYVKDGVGADEYFAITALVCGYIPSKHCPTKNKSPKEFAYIIQMLAGGVTAQIVVAVRYGITEKRNEQDVYEIGHQLKVVYVLQTTGTLY